MILAFIVAMSEDNAIGVHNQLPWHLPDDLKFFKRTTLGKPVLMGRKTFESLGKPLPGRLNIVVSSQNGLELPEGVVLCNDLVSGIERLLQESAEEGFIIGGGQVFTQAMPFAERMYITRVYTHVKNADAFFPHIDHTEWLLAGHEDHKADEKHKYDFTFERYERIEL